MAFLRLMKLVLKSLVLQVLYHLRVWHILLWLERRLPSRQQHAIVLLYHHLSSQRSGQELSEVEDGIPAEAFEMQVREFSRWYRPICSSELARASREPAPLSADAFVVTFDDGYLDNRQLAGPSLRKHGATGLIFLATNYIDQRAKFWWVRLNDTLRHAGPNQEVAIHEYLSTTLGTNGKPADLELTSWAARRKLRRRIATRLESMSLAEQTVFLDGLEKRIQVAKETCLPLITWRDSVEMLGEGFEFGAHTQSHPRMTRHSSSENQKELAGSVQTIADRLGKRPSTFAYPYGDFDERVSRDVRACGIELAFTVQPGMFVPGKTDPLRIPRLQPSWQQPYEMMPVIFAIKMAKRFPGLLRPVLSRMFGSSFQI